jgi:hypothetical protein
MAADHVGTWRNESGRLHGDYELRMRAPYTIGGDGKTVPGGIYAVSAAAAVLISMAWSCCLVPLARTD